MAKSERWISSEFPKKVGLEGAIEFNQKIWRGWKDMTQGISTIEIPDNITKPVFDRVLDKFGSYIHDDVHRKVRPLVGYSFFSEEFAPRGSRYYFPDIGKMRAMGLFVEFGTDWLAKVVYGEDPYKNNSYLKSVNSRIRENDTSSFEINLLESLLKEIKGGTIRKQNMTNVFARILLNGEMDLFKELGVEISDGTTETYGSEMQRLKVREDFARTVKKMNLARPFARDAGQTFYPGVIALSGSGQKPVNLAHEYIHALSFHEDYWVGIPVKGYKLMGNRVHK